MNPMLVSIAATIALSLTASLSQAANAPLDFAYRVTGAANVRPLMVFNDGSDTFIQPQDPSDKNLRVNGSQPTRQGPYFVVRGVGTPITISLGRNEVVTISYLKPTAVKPIEVLRPSTVEKTVDSTKPSINASVVESADETTKRASAALSALRSQTDSAKPIKVEPDLKPEAKPAACEPYKDKKESALVASFKGSSASLSQTAKDQIKDFIRDASDITSVEVIAEGTTAANMAKRGEALRSVLTSAGVRKGVIQVETRAATGIGSEIHVQRTLEIPCGAEIVNVQSRRSNATIIWDSDAKLLAQRLATQLAIPLTIEGVERPLPIRLAIADAPFAETMSRVGRVLDDNADLILRKRELVLRFKEKKE